MRFQKGHKVNKGKKNVLGKRWKKTPEQIENSRRAQNSGRRKKGDWTGEKNPHWKGGITDMQQKIRTSLEYSLWRTAVFERDKYTCVWCGASGVRLNADHIKPFSLFPELRLAIDNGRTLCEPCHRSTPTYGGFSRNV